MKKIMTSLTIVIGLTILAQSSFAAVALKCSNKDGEITLNPTTPCQHCNQKAPAYDFLSSGGLLADGIPDYDDDSMPGYIDFDAASSKGTNSDVISLIDGGTWNITMTFPKNFLSTEHAKGETVKATVDSSYSDVNDSELDGIEVTCVVQ